MVKVCLKDTVKYSRITMCFFVVNVLFLLRDHLVNTSFVLSVFSEEGSIIMRELSLEVKEKVGFGTLVIGSWTSKTGRTVGL